MGESSSDQLRLRMARELDRSYRLAGLLLGNFAEGEDATHDAMIRAWQAASSLRNQDDYQVWFDKILLNICRDRLRRRQRVRFVELGAEAGARTAPDAYGRMLDEDEILRAMKTLGPDLRIVILLRYWADLTVEQIAVRIGKPPGTVKSRLHTGHERIRRALATAGETEVPT
jgi:RNA polymerase sigma-70 factor (ECF subfamily)